MIKTLLDRHLSLALSLFLKGENFLSRLPSVSAICKHNKVVQKIIQETNTQVNTNAFIRMSFKQSLQDLLIQLLHI